ncbi:unnamed protein product, partial [Adineta ricciae]
MNIRTTKPHLTKDTIIHQHDLLMQAISKQRISLRDKDNLLSRLEEISNDITANRHPAGDKLQDWENQLMAIQDDLQNALVNYVPHGRRSWFRRELHDIISKIYSYGLKHLITVLAIIILLGIVLIFLWHLLVFLSCNYIPFAGAILPFCKAEVLTKTPESSPPNLENPTIKIPSVSAFVEKTTDLAERLSSVDVNAPTKLTEVKISLIDLKARVVYSNLEQPTKQIIKEKIVELRTSVESTTDSIHKMLSGFGGTLSKLEIYTKYALTYIKDES